MHYKQEVERLTEENKQLHKASNSVMVEEPDEQLTSKVSQLSHLLLKTEAKIKELEIKLAAKHS